VLSRRLPNGWSFGLPNSVYSTAAGGAFDVTGIPPDIPVAVFGEADLQGGKDPAIEAARHVLSKVRNGDH
jgi:C-terminal processing protease CtpA/Prc